MPRLLLLTVLVGLTLASAPATAADSQGFIYGTLTLQDGETHTGFIRWDSEEAFWDDLFHSRQDELPWLEHVDMEELQAERRRLYFETHGMFDRVMWTLNNKGNEVHISRLFICRFGHLDGLEIDTEENITALIRGGEPVPIHGYSNDVSSDLIVYPSAGEPVEVDWDDLASIAFSPAPSDAEPYAQRLYGKVESTEGNYEGFIQWDQSECTSIDMLDGDDHEIPMGDIRSITKNRKNNSDIVLRDGNAFPMAGSNDVGGGNRGVMVENPEWGRVTIAWKRFVSVTFVEGKGSGAGRDAFSVTAPLKGTVTGADGEIWTGRIVYDLDEAWTHDLFNGAIRNLDFDIPFAQISSIENLGDESCRVILTSGRTLDLGGSHDSGEKHGGLLVFEAGTKTPTYIPWSKVGVITFNQ